MENRARSTVEKIALPDRSCSQVPFWFWNGALDPAEMRAQVGMMVSQRVTAMMPHPRYGMDRREYLEAPYWKALDATLDEARQLDAKVVLYDEFNWPSGAAGGRVTHGRPDLYPNGLDYTVREAAGPGIVRLGDFAPGQPDAGRFDTVVKAFLVPEGCPCIFDSAVAEEEEYALEEVRPWGGVTANGSAIEGELPAGNHRILVFFRCFGTDFSSLDTGSNAFVDYLNPDAVERFIALTHEQYRQRYGQHFGSLIPALFTDEPSMISGGPFPWTGDFQAAFCSRCGYDLLDVLPALSDDRYPDGYAIRADYWRTVAELFTERFLGRVGSWCREAGIALTGHIYDEYIGAWPAAPHLMQWLRCLDWPGMDALGVRAGTASCKIPASVAHLEGSEHLVCEALGLADGWNATLGMAKRGYQFLAAMGVDLFVPHAFHQTVENPRVECPPSYFHQNPYWPYYHHLAELTSRLCAFNRAGSHVAPVAVYYPIESLWADGTGGRGQQGQPYQVVTNGNGSARETIRCFDSCLELLGAGPFDCDVVDSQALLSGVVDPERGRLQIGPEGFSCILLPGVRTLDSRVIGQLRAFVQGGGYVFFVERLPERYYPRQQDSTDALLEPWMVQHPDQVKLLRQIGDLPAALVAVVPPVVRFPGDTRPDGIYCLARRTDEDALWLFVNDEAEDCSFSATLPLSMLGGLRLDRCAVQRIAPETGSVTVLPAQRAEAGLQVEVCLGHTEACILHVSEGTPAGEAVRPASQAARGPARDAVLEDWRFRLVSSETTGLAALQSDSAVCALGRWRCCSPARKKDEVWFRPDFDDSAWQTVAALRGEARVEDKTAFFRSVLPPGAYALQVPLPANGEYQLYINGHLVEKRLGPAPRAGVLPIESFVEEGRNVIALEVYSAADFPALLEPLKVHCRSVRLSGPVAWDQVGLDWYSGRAVYSCHTRLAAPGREAWLDLGEVQHYAEIWVNGQHATTRLWPPYKAEIAALLQTGDNRIAIIVSNSLANRFVWDRWTPARTGESNGVPPRKEPSGLLGPVRLVLS